MAQLRLASSLANEDDPARGVIHVALAELGETAEHVSAAIGMPGGYLTTFLRRGFPGVLPGGIRRRLAAYLGLAEHALR